MTLHNFTIAPKYGIIILVFGNIVFSKGVVVMYNYRKKCYLTITLIVFIFIFCMTVSYAGNNDLKYKNLVGSNRYTTSLMISKEAYPNGARCVFLVTGTSNVDGMVVGTLANKFSGPILLVQKDKLTDGVKNEIKRLKATKAYLIGGSDVLSDKIVTELKGMNVSSERLFGDTRYSTATAVASKIGSFDKIIICNSRDNMLNASAISGIAAQNGIPILYNDSNISINTNTYKFIKNNVQKIKTVYLVGNGISSAQQKELNKSGISVVKLTGKTPYDLNVEMLNKINKKYNNVVLVNNAVDVISASYLVAKKNSLFIFTNTDLNLAQKNLIKNNMITEIYYTGGGKIKGPVKEAAYVIENKIATDNLELDFSKSKVVFYIPHQDDESLYYSQTILKAIEEKGKDNVYVVLITDGGASKIQYAEDVVKQLEPEIGFTFSKARDNEYLAACRVLGIKEENILFNEELGIERLKDGKVDHEDVKATMLYFENKFNGDVTHVTYTFKFDYHKDHRALGTALNELYYDLDLKENSFTSVYFIIRANYDGENGSTKETKLITLKEICNGEKIINALNIYLEPHYSENINERRIGIGGISVYTEMITVQKNVRNKVLTTQLHLPY